MNPHIQTVLNSTEPLAYKKGNRFPLFVWAVNDLSEPSTEDPVNTLKLLGERGIAAFSSWRRDNPAESLAASLSTAKHQKNNGQWVTINANDLLNRFCNGEPDTAHVTADGTRFFDTSFSESIKMGGVKVTWHRGHRAWLEKPR